MTIQLNPPRLIHTQRLRLRPPTSKDAVQLFDAYISKPHIPKFMSWVAHSNISQTEEFLQNCISSWENQSNFEYIIELIEYPGEAIGMIGMHPLDHGVGFGYVIAEEFWNRGITSEALKVLVDWSLTNDEVYRAQAHCDVENLASAKVMENAGMRLEGVLRRYFVHPNISKEPRDSLMYARIK